MGIEKIEPLTARKELTRAILNLQQTHLRGTGLRFKVATLIQKWNIYQSYWNRTMRDIEAGRYVRHVATARRRAESKGVPFPADEMGLHMPLLTNPHHQEPDELRQPPGPSSPEDQASPPSPPGQTSSSPPGQPSQPGQASQPGVSSQPRQPSPSSSQPRLSRPPEKPVAIPPSLGMSEAELRALHQRVVSAQRELGDPVEMRFETLVVQLSRQVPKLLAEHECKSVTFDVITRDGKVKLKPSPQK
jgi:hypothetical protein